MTVIPEEGSATVSFERCCQILGLGRSTAYELQKRGQFPIEPIRIGRSKKYPLWRIEQFLLGTEAA